MVSGVALVAAALALGAAATYLVHRWRLLAGLGMALLLGGLARAVGMASGMSLVDLADVLLWPGSGLHTGVAVGMDLPAAVAGYTWSLTAVEIPWLPFWLLIGAGAALLSLASSEEEHLPALVALALLGGLMLAAAGTPASGLWGAGILLCAVTAMLGDRDAALAFLGSGVVGIMLLLLAVGEERTPSVSGAAAVLSLAFWFGCPPWGPWASLACRRGAPVGTGFALAFLPSLGWKLLRPAVALAGPSWFLGGAAWLLVVGGLAALVQRRPRNVWSGFSLVNLGLVVLAAARLGSGWEGVGWALAWRAAALAAVALACSQVLEGALGALWRWRGAAFALLAGLAALAGLPPLPPFGFWRGVLTLGGEPTIPGWAVAVAAGALGASALGWWRVLLTSPQPPTPFPSPARRAERGREQG